MAVLTNITVKDSDLRNDNPDIDNIKYNDDIQADYDHIITEAKIEVFGQIKVQYKKDNPSDTNAAVDTALEDVKDYPDQEFIKKRIIKLANSIILRQNKMYEEADVYRDLAEKYPLMYYIDVDEDSVIATDEEKLAQTSPVFRRG